MIKNHNVYIQPSDADDEHLEAATGVQVVNVPNGGANNTNSMNIVV